MPSIPDTAILRPSLAEAEFACPLDPPGSPTPQLPPNLLSWISGTKIVGRDGRPLLLWRGDSKPICNYNAGGRFNPGIFLAAEKERADTYGVARPFYVKAVNPLDLRDPTHAWVRYPKAKAILADLFEDHFADSCDRLSGEPFTLELMLLNLEAGSLWSAGPDGGWTMRAWKGLQDKAKRNGFDCLIAPDGGEGIGVGISYAVFDSARMKLAEGNNGEFSPASPRVDE